MAMPGIAGTLRRVVGAAAALCRSSTYRDLALLALVRDEGVRCSSLSDDEMRRRSAALGYRARAGESLDRLLPESFALVREAAARTLGLRHYDVQVRGGIALHFGGIAEMPTGEGKTLTATLPAFLAALPGRGVHIATANDYLAGRDAAWMRPVFAHLGLTVGAIDSQTPQLARRQAYACDITFSTARELGFDFLRDRLAQHPCHDGEAPSITHLLGSAFATPPHDGDVVQRGHYCALLDEADNILIDEARTPLVVSVRQSPDSATDALFRWSAGLAEELVAERDFIMGDEPRGAAGSITLTASGRQKTRARPRPRQLDRYSAPDLFRAVARAVRVRREFLPDRHYLVRGAEVVIVDEYTGRTAEGRRWRDGVHQALEAKEHLPLSPLTTDAARVTVQAYFRRYERLAGMTGTASEARRELQRVYGLRVVTIPPNRRSRRVTYPTRIFADAELKWQAIVAEVQDIVRDGRAVLIGTRSIDKSEHLSRLLAAAGIDHAVLNAKRLHVEAETIAAAGQPGRVTVATNLAGRGTDITLDPAVRERGGLHVIGSELHESRRIDRQLMGRCGRQGDPGSYRQFLAWDDDILDAADGGPGDARPAMPNSQSVREGREATFRATQRRIERQHAQARQLLLRQERERQRLFAELGLDPYLDGPA